MKLLLVNRNLKKLYFFICLFAFVNFPYILKSQIPETPEITYLNVNHLDKNVEIHWTVNSVENIDGFIIKRKIIDGSGAVLGTFNTVATIEENSVFQYTDVSTEFNTTSKPYERSEFYSVVAFREENEVITFSNLSNYHNTIFLSSNFDACQKTNFLKWNKYIGWDIVDYNIYYKTENELNFNLLTTTSDTTYNHLITETNEQYFYYIQAVSINGFNSNSNISETTTSSSELIDYINADYATVKEENQIEIKFTIAENESATNYKLIRSVNNTENFDTIAEFPANQLNISYIDNISTTQKNYYKLLAFDYCNSLIGESNIASNLLITISLDNGEKYSNIINWQQYSDWNGEIENQNLYLSFEDSEFELLTELPPEIDNYQHFINEYIVKEFNGKVPVGKFCYYIENYEYNNPYQISGKSKSNISCIIQEPIIYFPTAFNPLSRIEENSIFKPKYTFVNDYLLIVYSKFGNKIFETTDPNEGWNGKDSFGNYCMQGTYTYYVKLTDNSKKKFEKTGYINLFY